MGRRAGLFEEAFEQLRAGGVVADAAELLERMTGLRDQLAGHMVLELGEALGEPSPG